MEIEQIITDFCNLLIDLCRNIAEICPDSIVGANIKDVEKAINNQQNKLKIMDGFVAKVLKYKNEIDMGDENFFLSKSYDNDMEEHISFINKIFEFKTIWGQLKRENKDLVIQYMQLLCELAQRYFLLVCNNI